MTEVGFGLPSSVARPRERDDLMAKPSDIKNEILRDLLTAAHDAIRSGDYTQSVRHSAEAVRQLVMKNPELAVQRAQLGGRYLPPNVGARLVTENVSEPQVIFDREKFTMAEALTWYQYALESVLTGETSRA